MIGGGVAHVLSRANARATLFRTDDEYGDFVGLLDEARRAHGVALLAFCVMPNHFHLVTQVDDGTRLSAMMQWWLTTHVRRHHKRLGTRGQGHLWQGRFKSLPVQEDAHLLTVLRYVLRNPVRAHLVDDAWKWPWSSLWFNRMVAPWPVPNPGDLRQWLGGPGSPDHDADVRYAIQRSAPYGDEGWRAATARALGLEPTLRSVRADDAGGLAEPVLGL